MALPQLQHAFWPLCSRGYRVVWQKRELPEEENCAQRLRDVAVQ